MSKLYKTKLVEKEIVLKKKSKKFFCNKCNAVFEKHSDIKRHTSLHHPLSTRMRLLFRGGILCFYVDDKYYSDEINKKPNFYAKYDKETDSIEFLNTCCYTKDRKEMLKILLSNRCRCEIITSDMEKEFKDTLTWRGL